MFNVNRAQIRQLRSAEGAAGLRICFMGPLTVENDGKPLAIASRKARALLGYLIQRKGIETARSTLTRPALGGA
jgi:two-component SAPR family response regulator